MKNDFENYTERVQQNAEHAQEIVSSRVGGLGGSDAAIVLKIGRGGLAALTASDTKRLAVMVGLAKMEDFGGNRYTNAGHAFEDYVDKYIGKALKRETLMEAKLAKNFRTFAHADFTEGENNPFVTECKFVTTKTTEQVLATYEAQLQWYYLLGASHVTLLHGTGTVENEAEGIKFEVQNMTTVSVKRDESIIKALENGIKILDEALASGWKPVTLECTTRAELPTNLAVAYDSLITAKKLTAEAKALEDCGKKMLRVYMDGFGYNSIADDESGTKLTLQSGRTTTTFDLKAFKKMLEEDERDTFTYADVLEVIERATTTKVGNPTLMFK